MTIRINLEPYLCEYLIGKYGYSGQCVLRLPDGDDLYHLLYDLLEKRPANVPVDRGNIELQLPRRRVGKSPLVYNFMGVRSQEEFSRRVSLRMWAEVHDYLDDQHHRYGVSYISAIRNFLLRYGICSLSEDTILKNYYRWRMRVRFKRQKRAYLRKKP